MLSPALLALGAARAPPRSAAPQEPMTAARSIEAPREGAGAWLLGETLGGLDAVRGRLVRTGGRVRPIAGWLRSQDTRVASLATLAVVVAFALTLAAPAALFVLGPATLGVVHVASDFRYLVVRRRCPPIWIATVVACSAALFLLRSTEIRGSENVAVRATRSDRRDGAGQSREPGWGPRGWAARKLASATRSPVPLFSAERSRPRSRIRCSREPCSPTRTTSVALVIWIALFRARSILCARARRPGALGTLALACGHTLLGPISRDLAAERLVGEALDAMPRLPQRLALSVGLSYVFLQAIHYSTWLTLIPQEQVRAGATLTFRMSLRSARRDFGRAAYSPSSAWRCSSPARRSSTCTRRGDGTCRWRPSTRTSRSRVLDFSPGARSIECPPARAPDGDGAAGRSLVSRIPGDVRDRASARRRPHA